MATEEVSVLRLYVLRGMYLRAIGRSTDLTQGFLVGIVLDLIVIPWPYVFAHYIKKPGTTAGTQATFTLELFQDVAAHFACLQKYTAALRLPDPTEWARKHGV